MRASAAACRSASQKNRASRSRAVSTRSRLRETTSGLLRLDVQHGEEHRQQLARGRSAPERNADDESSSSSALPRAASGTLPRSARRRRRGTRRGPAPRASSDCPTSAVATRPPRRRASTSSSRAMRLVALAALEDDEILGQALAVIVEALDLDRAAGAAARGQEAVAVGDRAGADVLHQRRPARWRRAMIVNGTTRPP